MITFDTANVFRGSPRFVNAWLTIGRRCALEVRALPGGMFDYTPNRLPSERIKPTVSMQTLRTQENVRTRELATQEAVTRTYAEVQKFQAQTQAGVAHAQISGQNTSNFFDFVLKGIPIIGGLLGL